MTNIIPRVDNNIQSTVKTSGFGYAWMPMSYPDFSGGNQRGPGLDSMDAQAKQGYPNFIGMVIIVIEEHLSNYKFDIQTLARDLNMSRRQLFRKFKVLAGCTPNIFIRNLRLERAARLLWNTRMTVLEITYAVGFCDPKYFRGIFKEKYGILPSVYAKQSSSGLIR
jgi:transcriptional regulator GlxA family with amidase domain